MSGERFERSEGDLEAFNRYGLLQSPVVDAGGGGVLDIGLTHLEQKGTGRQAVDQGLSQQVDGTSAADRLTSMWWARPWFSRQEVRNFYGPEAGWPWGVNLLRPLICVMAMSLSIMAFPAWSQCNQPDRTPTSRYVINGGEVYDTQTRLTWARCSVGQVWTKGEGCVGTIRTLTFEQAKQRVDATWRLPTGKELVTLVAWCQHPAINSEVFPNMNMPLITLYWTDAKDDNEFPSVVDFYFGGPTVINRSNKGAVRLVHR